MNPSWFTLQPIKPLCADRGEGCAAVNTWWRALLIRAPLFCASRPQSKKTIFDDRSFKYWTTVSWTTGDVRKRDKRKSRWTHGEFLPSFAFVRIGFALLHGQAGVEKQHALFRPSGQGAVRWSNEVGNIGFQLFVHIQKTKGKGSATTDFHLELFTSAAVKHSFGRRNTSRGLDSVRDTDLGREWRLSLRSIRTFE